MVSSMRDLHDDLFRLIAVPLGQADRARLASTCKGWRDAVAWANKEHALSPAPLRTTLDLIGRLDRGPRRLRKQHAMALQAALATTTTETGVTVSLNLHAFSITGRGLG